jgi:mRNA interferase MazF
MLTSGDVVMLYLGVPEGREAGFSRPAVVVTAQRILTAGAQVVHVVPITSRIRRFDSDVRVEADSGNGLGHDSAIQCQHLRSVSTKRLASTTGNVGPAVLAEVRETLAAILDLPV